MFSRMNAFGSLSVLLPLVFLSRSRANVSWSCILANIPGDVVLLVMLLVEMHKRAVGTLSSELFYKLQLGKTGWVVGGWFLLLVVYRGSLVMMVLDWRVWSSLVVDVVYMWVTRLCGEMTILMWTRSPFVAALVLVLKEKREEGISLLWMRIEWVW
jgi:hypothetical protein